MASLIKNFKLLFLCPIFFLFGSLITFNALQYNDDCIAEKINNENKRYYRTANFLNPNLVILIISAPGNLDRRNTIRETWLTLEKDKKELNHIHYFVVGSDGLSRDAMLHLSDEQSKHNDLLILTIHDSYSKLTEKVLKSFVWINEQITYGLDFNYLLKCDDDSFVRIQLLNEELKELNRKIEKKEYVTENDIQNIHIQKNVGEVEKNVELYWGYFRGSAKVKKGGKWKEENWILCDNYLPYAQGGGYILSKKLIQFIARNAEELR